MLSSRLIENEIYYNRQLVTIKKWAGSYKTHHFEVLMCNKWLIYDNVKMSLSYWKNDPRSNQQDSIWLIIYRWLLLFVDLEFEVSIICGPENIGKSQIIRNIHSFSLIYFLRNVTSTKSKRNLCAYQLDQKTKFCKEGVHLIK